MILTSLLLLAALVYTGVYLYRYLIGYGDLLSLPKPMGLNLFLTIAPVFFITAVASVVLLSRERPEASGQEYSLTPEFLQDEQPASYDLNTLSMPQQPADVRQEPQRPQEEEPKFIEALKQECEYSSNNKYELSVVLLNIQPDRDQTDFDRFSKRIADHFLDTAFIHEYEVPYSMVIIMPFYSFEEVKQELVSLYQSLKSDLDRRSVLFRAGFTSKFSRYIDAYTMLYESESAFEKVTETPQSGILGFEPDLDAYQQYYSG